MAMQYKDHSIKFFRNNNKIKMLSTQSLSLNSLYSAYIIYVFACFDVKGIFSYGIKKKIFIMIFYQL
jgi:hypothetical protein